jgi:polygalacturonase
MKWDTAILCLSTLRVIKLIKNSFFRPNLVRLINTVNITVYNLTMKDSPSWTFHLANTTNVHVYNFTALASNKSHNTDGIDIECSVNVLVEDYFYIGGRSCHSLDIAV